MTKARDLSQTPNASLGFKNRIINGAMMIDQRNAGASVTPTSSSYTLDRWRLGTSVASKVSVQQSSVAPVGFTSSVLITTVSAYSFSTAQEINFGQRIEGFNTADLNWGTANASPVTLSFWVRSSLTGTFGGVVKNSGNTLSYPISYTINAANTWEQKSVTITGATTSTWETTSSASLYVQFCIGAASDLLTTAGSWASGNFAGATGSTNIVGTNGATFYITGVQLEKGSTATSFDYRPYGTELALCQRYYQKIIDANISYGSGFVISTTQARVVIPFFVEMRNEPTAMETSGTAADYTVLHGAASTVCSLVPSMAANSKYNSRLLVTVASGLTTGQGCMLGAANSGDSFLAWSAEL